MKGGGGEEEERGTIGPCLLRSRAKESKHYSLPDEIVGFKPFLHFTFNKISVFQTPAKTYSRSEHTKQHQNKSGIETGCEMFCFSFLLTGKCETKCTSTIACDRVQGRVG